MSADEPTPRNGPDELIGTVLSDRYRLEEQIGSGGMGTVWKATDTLLNRPVAVKLLHLSQMAEPTARQRFRTEGRITAGLSHPGIAQVYDYGEEDGRAFLIMELVVGEPLSQVLRDHGRLTPDQTLDFLCQAAQALAAAHARGVVHRDIKPGNLLVTGDGQLKLTDFGIARGDMSVTLTQTGMVMGTAQYISPEQALGRPASSASDLYALGVVAYECLAGTPPFTGDSPVALALAHTRDEPPELPDHVPAEVDDLVAALLVKDPQERPSSASEVAHMAAVIRSDAGTGPPTPSAGFSPMAATAVVSAVPGPSTGATPRRTAGQPAVSPGRADDSARLGPTSGRRVGLPVLVAAVAATVVIAGAVLAGFMWDRNTDADTARDTVDTPATEESTPSDTPSEEVEDTNDGYVEPEYDHTPNWNDQPAETVVPESPEPSDPSTDSPEPDGEDGTGDGDDGTTTPDPPGDGEDDGDDGDGGDPPIPDPGGNGGGGEGSG
ncbi:serine/threonine-protein kinase [Nocardiopsis sp. Huas11]|uniref:serine/threonine-protein kinase n=1 Tax=Nocardiopsis sp. Huas11 TaxID=2183912 RepID=UPI000EB44891|nr:serine/threonine-protein kinase [Nocardiopsis sp. Huas11]RKS06516.1 serine/threonine-protein kinase [Nocardiopsis sp. Huas11]